MSTPRLTVIVPTFNRPKKLAATIACYQRQTLPACDYEIIVVDDGSSPPVCLPANTGPAPCEVVRLDQHPGGRLGARSQYSQRGGRSGQYQYVSGEFRQDQNSKKPRSNFANGSARTRTGDARSQCEWHARPDLNWALV